MSLDQTLKLAAREAIALYSQYLRSGKISQVKFDRYVAKVQRNTGVKA
ncbi:MAG TPA: hypothetical protein V6C63_07700 [Allocoleopsis sp.]